MTKCWGIVPAAGVGQRMIINRPKQYIEIAGKYIIEHSYCTVATMRDDRYGSRCTKKKR